MRLELEDVRVECIIGDLPAERVRKQILHVSAKMEIDESASSTDELSGTVDYSAIVAALRTRLENAKCKMIERAAKIVAETCLEFPQVRSVEAEIRKDGSLPGLKCVKAVFSAMRALLLLAAPFSAMAEDAQTANQSVLLASQVLQNGYTEDFTCLYGTPSENNGGTEWVDCVNVPFWYAWNGSDAAAKITAKSGPSTNDSITAGLYAYHSSKTSDKASYSLAWASNTKNNYGTGFSLSNDTGLVLKDLAVSFEAIQWTFNTNRLDPQALHFAYEGPGTVPIAGQTDWAEIAAASFAGEIPWSETGEFADPGTKSRRRSTIARLDDVEVKPGATICFKWYSDAVAKGHAFGVDNVSLEFGTYIPGFAVRIK